MRRIAMRCPASVQHPLLLSGTMTSPEALSETAPSFLTRVIPDALVMIAARDIAWRRPSLIALSISRT